MLPAATRLSPVDLAIVAVYLVAITVFGLRFSRRSAQAGAGGLKSYFLADNTIPWWAIALSIVSAETSTLTIISIPGVAYAGDLGFLQIVLGYLLGRVVVAMLFLPRYFRGEMLTAYQLIDQRFGPALHKLTASLFLLTRAAAEGVRVFAISIVVGIAIGTGDTLSIAIISALTLLYTFEGGMAAVIWTDVVQMALYVVGTVVALAILGAHVPGGWAHIHTVAAPLGKFHMLDFTLNLTITYTFWAGVLGGTFLTMASHGTDQLMVQRMLAARNLRESRLALLSSGVVVFIQFLLFLLIGVGLFVFYQGHPVHFSSADRIFPTFIVTELPHGVAGLLVAAILAAAMSNLSAALNSLASTTVVDFWLPLTQHGLRTPLASQPYREVSGSTATANTTLISRAATVFWAIVLFLIAVYSIRAGGKGHVVETGLSIASVAYGSLLGVFLLGTLTKFATQTGAIIGMVTGFVLNLWLWQAHFPKQLGPMGHPYVTISHVAFTWYVFLGALVTFAVGAAVSLAQPRRKPAVATVLLILTTMLPSRSAAEGPAVRSATIVSPAAPRAEGPAHASLGRRPRYQVGKKQSADGATYSVAMKNGPTNVRASAGDTPTPDFTPVSTLINAAIAAHKLPGAVVVIGHNGRIAFKHAYGNRKLAGEPGPQGELTAEPMTEDTVFDMASLTKVIVTTTAILQLYEQGKLSLDTPVAHYLPDFARATPPSSSISSALSSFTPSLSSRSATSLSSRSATSLSSRSATSLSSRSATSLSSRSATSLSSHSATSLSSRSAAEGSASQLATNPAAPSIAPSAMDGITPSTPPTLTPQQLAWKERITVRQLLTHYSGLPEDVPLKDPWGLAVPDKAEGIRRALAAQPYGPPGVTFKYSDINFITLGTLVEKLSRLPLDLYASQLIFKPMRLGVTSYLAPYCTCSNPRPPAFGLSDPQYDNFVLHPNVACGRNICFEDVPINLTHNLIAPTAPDNEGTPATNPDFDHLLRGTVHDPTTRRMGGVAGHAGVFSTADDMSTFAQALLDKLLRNTGPFPLKQSTLQMATSPQAPTTAAHDAAIFLPDGTTTKGVAQRGLGWDLNSAFSRPRGTVFPITTGGYGNPGQPAQSGGHTGSFGHTGFTGTSLWVDPTTDTYVLLLANAIHPRGAPPISTLRGEIATAAARALGLGIPAPLSSRSAAEGSASPTATALRHPERSAAQSKDPDTPRPAATSTPSQPQTLTGIDVLESTHFAQLKALVIPGHPLRIALLTNQSGIDAHGHPTLDILLEAAKQYPDLKLVKVFTPEHGLYGQQDTEHLTSETTPTGLPVISLYGAHPADRHPKPADLADVDIVIIDLQDIGTRFWTYETVVRYFLESSACKQPHLHNLTIVLLDRPNPVGGLATQGPISDPLPPGTDPYINSVPMPVRHGLTLGEVARFFLSSTRGCLLPPFSRAVPGPNGTLTVYQGGGFITDVSSSLTVIPMQHWSRADFFPATGLPWTPPSPNMKHPSTAVVYPGVALLETTNLSVGRGTPNPYENLGAAWMLHPETLAAYLNDRHIPGIRFTPTTLTIAETPEHYPAHGTSIPGLHLEVTDPAALDSPEMGIELLTALSKLYPADFQLAKAATILANADTLTRITAGEDPRAIAQTWSAGIARFRAETAPFLLYPESAAAPAAK